MLREFLRKIFSPPQPIEDKRIQPEDFARLKKHIKSEDQSSDQVCNIEHGPLSDHHWQHAPLTRSVSIHASQAAYEHYLQRNAARADNWSEFDETLHPTLAGHDIQGKAASFLTPEEEAELAQVRPPEPSDFEKRLNAFLQPQHESEIKVTPYLVYSVEKLVSKTAAARALTSTKHWTFTAGASKKPKWLNSELAYKYCKGWLKKKAASDETSADGLRELARSSMVNVRAAAAGNERIPFDCLWTLAHDSEAKVRRRLAMNPNCTIELLETLSSDPNENVSAEARRIKNSIIS